MSKPILPAPIAAYYAADRQDPETLARCFTPRAVVKDEGIAHIGHEAIRAWKAKAARYAYTAEPFALEQERGSQVVRAHVRGDFPGSPVDLRYRCELEGGLIASMEITA